MVQKRKILFLHSGAELYGSDKILLEILKLLDKDKFEPLVVIPNKGVLEEEFKKSRIEYIIYDFPILRRKYFNIKGIIIYICKFFKSILYLNSIVKKYNIDIITSNTLAVLEGAFYSKIFRIKHVWHIHEIIKEPKIMEKFYKKIVPYTAQNAICVSNAVKDNLFSSKDEDKVNIKVIHNGINIERFTSNNTESIKKSLNIDNNRIIVGMVGRINKIKGQLFMVDVAKELVEKYPNILIIMVGGVFSGQESLKIELEEKIAKNNLEEHIKLFEFDKEIGKYYEIFDIFVLPSVKPDSFPTVVLEAMSYSKPIIAHVTGGVSEMVQDNENGILIRNINTSNTAKAIENLLIDENKRMIYGTKSRMIMEEKFSTKTFSEKINNFYLNI